MSLSTIYGRRVVALGGAMLLCGSMGFAQMHGSAGSSSQAPGQNPSTDPQMNGMQTAAGQPSSVDRMFVGKAMQGSLAEVQLGQVFCLSLPLVLPGGNYHDLRRRPPALRPLVRDGQVKYNLRSSDRRTDVFCDDCAIAALKIESGHGPSPHAVAADR